MPGKPGLPNLGAMRGRRKGGACAPQAIIPHGIAAHAEHVRWAVQLVNDYFDGKASQASWSESWTVREVDAEQWDRLRAELREAGEKLLENLRERQRWNDDMALNGALASYGHTAYHLGALRQFMKRVTGGRA